MGLMPRCVGTCRDGSQCGRRVTDGSHPPLCHLHKPNPTLSPIIPRPEDMDPLKELRQLTKNRDSRVRIRALDLLLKREAAIKECPQCAARGNDAELRRHLNECLRRMTDEQHAEARQKVHEAKRLLDEAMTIIRSASQQPIHPDMVGLPL